MEHCEFIDVLLKRIISGALITTLRMMRQRTNNKSFINNSNLNSYICYVI